MKLPSLTASTIATVAPEAVEGAIKFARKVSYEAGKPDKTGIVAFENAFHGRTIGALAADSA